MSEWWELICLLARPKVAWAILRSLRLPSLAVVFEPRDLWVGVYWNPVESLMGNWIALDVYVCIVPCIPIVLTWGVPKHRRTADWSDLPSGEVRT